MYQTLDPEDWRSICFESIDLPPSLMGISILVSDEGVSELTGDWIWRLRHCWDYPKSGEAAWCYNSADAMIDHLIDHRTRVIQLIDERLSEYGFDPQQTFQEWIEALTIIKATAESRDDVCSWIAASPRFDSVSAREQADRFLKQIDRYAADLEDKKNDGDPSPPLL